MGIDTEIDRFIKKSQKYFLGPEKEVIKDCLKCGMRSILEAPEKKLKGIIKEWERVHKHEEKKESLSDKIWRWIR